MWREKMSSKLSFADRLKKARMNIGLTQAEVAKRSGLTRAAISQYELGIVKGLKSENLIALSKTLGLDPEELATGAPSVTGSLKRADVSFVPLIDLSSVNILLAGGLDTQEKYMPTTSAVGDDGFALELLGDDMQNNTSNFSEGSVVIFDPSREPESGDHVLAKLSDNSIIFRQLKKAGALHSLVPLNSQYPVTQVPEGEYKILAVAVQTLKDV